MIKYKQIEGKNMNHKNKRKTIPKTLKNNIWDKYIGKDKGIGKCDVCENDIDSKNFDCGHIISVKDNGETNIDN